MAFTNIISSKQIYSFGSTSKVLFTIGYENSRSGTDVKYRFSWELKFSGTSPRYNNPVKLYIYLNGSSTASEVSMKATTSGTVGTYSGTTGWYTVANKISGTTPVYFKVKDTLNSNQINYTSSSFSMAIPAYKATITSAPDFTSIQNPTIKYNNAFTSADGLQACISLTGATDDVSYRDISISGSSYTFNLTTTERNTLIAAVPSNSTSVKVYFYIKTIVGTEERTDYIQKTFTLVNSAPTIDSVTIVDTNSATTALTGNNNKLIKYCSNANFSISATPNNGASITSYKVVNGSKTLSSSTGTINAVENNTFNITVTDSRGFTANTTITKDMVNYIKPTIALSAEVTNPALGTVSFDINGNVFSGSFGSVSNLRTIQIRSREKGGSWGTWQKCSPTTYSSGKYSYSGTLTLDYTKQHDIQAQITDKIFTSGIQSNEIGLSFLPSFYWDKDNFYFNQDVFIKGTDLLSALFYKPEEPYNQSISTAGYITTSASQINFSVPLGKHLGLVNKFTLSQISLVARQDNKYIFGSGSGGSNCVGSWFDTTATIKDGFLNIVIKKYSGTTHDTEHQSPFNNNPTNNAPVGIQATITGSWSYDANASTSSNGEGDIIED